MKDDGPSQLLHTAHRLRALSLPFYPLCDPLHLPCMPMHLDPARIADATNDAGEAKADTRWDGRTMNTPAATMANEKRPPLAAVHRPAHGGYPED